METQTFAIDILSTTFRLCRGIGLLPSPVEELEHLLGKS